ncbi:hypothetical protein [Clostridium kluyveri]|uniref:hypothetical protein n=1 Tax=Clostridium kluyveri TaxID=1534 RepID=UPI0022481650|nr:hypothetical protein [Clostridium kluyveri]UZQ49885.1 hypothetical protein OP486_18345 [Clostridium kluyveri]
MFYPELSKISSDNAINFLSEELINEIDTWLALLPYGEQDKITISKFSTKFNLTYDISRIILEKLCNINILKRIFAISCPECNHVLKITDEENLYNDIIQIKSCYNCESSDLSIDASNVEVRYKLIKKPLKDPRKIKYIEKKLLGTSNNISEEDTILNYIKKSKCNCNNMFYHPEDEEYKVLKELFHELNENHINTTEKGSSFEDLIIYILNLVLPFEAQRSRTDINQIDCLVRNKFPLPGNILGEIGNMFYCECKNEKDKPGNDYFLKLTSILVFSQNGTKDRRFGIIFSIREPVRTLKKIAKKIFQNQNIILICIYKNDIEDIILNKKIYWILLRGKLMRLFTTL